MRSSNQVAYVAFTVVLVSSFGIGSTQAVNSAMARPQNDSISSRTITTGSTPTHVHIQGVRMWVLPALHTGAAGFAFGHSWPATALGFAEHPRVAQVNLSALTAAAHRGSGEAATAAHTGAIAL